MLGVSWDDVVHSQVFGRQSTLRLAFRSRKIELKLKLECCLYDPTSLRQIEIHAPVVRKAVNHGC